MRIPVLFTALLAFALATASPAPRAVAQDASAEVSFNLFYDNLADDGDWYNTPEYGYVWQPDIGYKNDTWRPYSDGYWSQTDGGWTWVSYENFGWATYHYGRWTRLKDIGWAWVPGYDWGPGWVSFRTSDDYVGWAPLPPKVQRGVYEGKVVERRAESIDYNDVEDEDEGYSSNVDVDYDIGPDNYCFVRTRSFGAPVITEVIEPYESNYGICEHTTNVTNIYYDRSGDDVYVYNGGPNYVFINERCERPIPRFQLERRRDPGFFSQGFRGGGNLTMVRGGVLQVAAPLIARRPVNFQQVRPPRIKQTLERPEIVHGWSRPGVDQQAVQRVRQGFRQQAQQAPAKAVAPRERVVQQLPEAQRVVTKSDLPVAPAKDMSPDAVAARRAERQKARAAQGDKPGPRPGQNTQVAPPAQQAAGQPGGQPGQPGQPGGNNGRRGGALTEADRVARREAAQKARETRDQGRASGQPGQPGQPAQAGQPGQPGATPKDNSEEARAARRAQRQTDRAAQQPGQPGQPAQPGATPKDNSEEARTARRAQRQQERAAQPQQAQPQPGGQPQQPTDQEREARRAQRQAERAQQPPQQQPQGNPQADQDRDARRAQRQAERAAQQPQQAQPQGNPQADQEREARRAQRQQQAQQAQQGNAEREARQAQRQQERAAQQQQAQQAQQGNADREARRAQRQQEQAAAQQQAQGNADREARQAQRQQQQAQQQQAQQQQAQQQQAQQQQGQKSDAEREARRAQRQAEKGKGDKPDQ